MEGKMEFEEFEEKYQTLTTEEQEIKIERKNKKNSFDIDVSVNFTFINSTKGICTIYYGYE